MPRFAAPGWVPKYRLHKRSGQAYVSLNGRDLYLGAHGSEQSRAEYDRVIAEWLSSGARPQQGVRQPELAPHVAIAGGVPQGATVPRPGLGPRSL
jgi:hypothetical protein